MQHESEMHVVTVECASVTELVASLEEQQPTAADILVFALQGDPSDHCTADHQQVKQLAGAIRNYSRSNTAAMAIERFDFGPDWLCVLEALGSAPRFTRWILPDNAFNGDLGLAIAKHFGRAPWVVALDVRNNPLSGRALEQIARAAVRRPRLCQLALVDTLKVETSPSLVATLIELNDKFPNSLLGGSGFVAKSLMGRLALSRKLMSMLLTTSRAALRAGGQAGTEGSGPHKLAHEGQALHASCARQARPAARAKAGREAAAPSNNGAVRKAKEVRSAA